MSIKPQNSSMQPDSKPCIWFNRAYLIDYFNALPGMIGGLGLGLGLAFFVEATKCVVSISASSMS